MCLWMRITDDEVRASTRASSIAVSPPPTTTTGLPEKRNPSQVAHELPQSKSMRVYVHNHMRAYTLTCVFIRMPIRNGSERCVTDRRFWLRMPIIP